MLKQEIIDSIPGYLTIYEDRVRHIYKDKRGIATTAIGVRVEPYDTYGYRFTFIKRDGKQASAAEVIAECKACKLPNYQPSMWASDAQVVGVTLKFFKDNWTWARDYFGPDFERYPADVQVVLAQMGYGGGLDSRKLSLKPYLQKRDFYGAMLYTTLGPEHQRYNKGFRILMTNGWIVEESIKKGSAMQYWAPKDLTQFWGIKRFLQIARWYTSDIIYEMRTTDTIIEGDCTAWLRKQLNK